MSNQTPPLTTENLQLTTPHHRLSLCTRLGALHLRVHLNLTAPWTLLFGPSGSGKSSILRAICGLLPNAAIDLERHNPDNSVTILQNCKTNIPPHLRDIRWSPQNAALFPHLTVRQNIEFSGEATATLRLDADLALVDHAIDLFHLSSLCARYPRDLSGGERQRVSLARAFAAPNCRLLLLDEPFNGIDRTLRDQLLPEMRRQLRTRNIPVLSVSHDVEEALQLDAHIIKLREGRIETEGPATSALALERTHILQTLNRNPT